MTEDSDDRERIMLVLSNAIFKFDGTYKQLAIRCGLSISTVSNIAQGKTKWPRHGTFFALCHVLNLELTLVEKTNA